MPFIGNQPALSYTSFAKQDFTTSATTSYTLDHPVTNENEIALFINFVRQEPTTAYSASGTSLTLTSATSASDDMYCVFLGKAVQTVNPPAGSVGASQISDGSIALGKLSATGTKDSTTFLRGDNTFASAGGANTPAFEATISSTQGVTLNGLTKVQAATEYFDIGSCYDNSTNYRFTPTTAGKYFVYGQIYFYNTAGSNTVQRGDARIYKNGSVHRSQLGGVSDYPDNTFNEAAATSISVIDFNGTSDYVELYVYAAGNTGTPTLSNGSGENFVRFGAYKIIE